MSCGCWKLRAPQSWAGTTGEWRRSCDLVSDQHSRPLNEPEHARWTESEYHHDRRRIGNQVIALRDTQPVRQQNRDQHADERPEKIATAADDYHEQQMEGEAERK